MFQPILPLTGYVGWTFLQRTLDTQQETFAASPRIERQTDHFRERIADITTAEDLVKDRQLLQVALGAFGLDEDLDNTFFIQKILSEGTESRESLASRLSDDRYRRLSDAFGFGSSLGVRTGDPGFADRMVSQFERQQFERAVGAQDNDMRSALNLGTGLSQIVEKTRTNDGRWFAIMGDPPVRAVMEKALNLPGSLAQIDIDLQLEAFKTSAKKTFGTDQVADLQSDKTQEDLVRLFLVRSEAARVAQANGATVALALVQAIPRKPLLSPGF
ncbi:DUF1217 domain-containing protein [Salipiger sp. IMCC34102]|uniref:DUF1217 domain-containing protein n=1 Tax=Salipiger sp. IMCC34102 TaxID=2510647 RepID=UPI001F5C23B1|nr:DUF1217 domain-containing protein [Salipiger sp. IMCC34102]